MPGVFPGAPIIPVVAISLSTSMTTRSPWPTVDRQNGPLFQSFALGTHALSLRSIKHIRYTPIRPPTNLPWVATKAGNLDQMATLPPPSHQNMFNKSVQYASRFLHSLRLMRCLPALVQRQRARTEQLGPGQAMEVDVHGLLISLKSSTQRICRPMPRISHVQTAQSIHLPRVRPLQVLLPQPMLRLVHPVPL